MPLSELLTDWQAVPAVGGFLLFWLWETWFPFFPQPGRFQHAARNLAVAGINLLVLALVIAGINFAMAETAAQRGWGLLNAVELPGAARMAIAVGLLDLWAYWWHRANHAVPLLWRFHRMHHSDGNMDVTTATRFHPGEVLISSAVRLPLIPVLGLPIEAILLYDLVLLATTQFHHANFGLTRKRDRRLRYVIVSPNMHKVHHSQERIETDSNYASILSVWDRLFGTYREKRDYGEICFGLRWWGGERWQSFRGMLATPLRGESDDS